MSLPEPPPTPQPPQLPRRGALWLRVARRVVQRLGLPLLGLAVLAAAGYFVLQNLPPAALPGQAAKPAARATPGGATQKPGARPVPAPETAPPGTELRVLMPNVATLDPGLAYDSETIPVIQLLFEGLLAVDASGRLAPRGAQRWEVSRDGLTYTFYLDPNARWSDGRAVKAEDYVFAWRRNVHPSTRSPYAPALFVLKNGAAINAGRLPLEQLGAEAKDDFTLVAHLEGPAPYFPSLVATWTYFPLRQDILQRYGQRWSEVGNLVGNGPYVLEGVRNATDVVLARNEQYAGPRPQVDRIAFVVYQNLGQALDAFRRGDLHIMPYTPRLKDVIAGDPLFERAIKIYPRSSTTFITLNHRRKALQDPRVRRALGMALDRQELINQLLPGAAQPAASLHPLGIAGRDASAWPREDVAEARRLLREAGYPDGQGLELVMAVPSAVDLLGPLLQQRWRDTLGVNVVLLPVDNMTNLRQSAQWQNELDMYVGSWQSDYEDPHNWFNLLWDSQNDPGQYNSGWRNAEFDRLVRAGQAELDAARREALYRQAERLMAQEYPLIPLYHPMEQYLVRPEVQGYQPGGTALTVPLLGVRLSAATPL